MKEGLGWILFVVALAVIGIMYFSKTPINVNLPIKPDDKTPPADDEVKCELMDTNGRIVSITGKSDDPQFQQMCNSQSNQQVYVYGYPYSFVSFRGGHGHHGGHGGGGHH